MSAKPSLSRFFSEGLPYPLNFKLQPLLEHLFYHYGRAFLLLFDFLSDHRTAQHKQLLTECSPSQTVLTSLGRRTCPALAYLANSYSFKDVYGMGNAEKRALNPNTVCKTSSPNTSANKWIHQCSFSIMGAICVLFSGNNAFCKITLNRKCLCCHF